MKPGTNPNVFWMSARAASASGVAARAGRGAAAAAASTNVRIESVRTRFIMATPPGLECGKLLLVIATRKRPSGYGPVRRIAAALPLLLLAAGAHASSIAFQTIGFGRAVTLSTRVVKGKVTARSEIKVDGATLHYVEIAVDAVLKGTPAKAGERVQVFNPAEWFQHTHAAAIKGGVISYADPHYATPVPDAQLKSGAAVLVFLRGDAPPPGFPPNAAFLSCGEAFERPARAGDVARMKTAAFGDPITLKVGEVAVLLDGLEVEVKGHSHKHPMVDGPQREMSELEVRLGKRAEPLTLGHTVYPGTPATESWDRTDWQQYELALVGMNYDSDTTLRVVRKNP